MKNFIIILFAVIYMPINSQNLQKIREKDTIYIYFNSSKNQYHSKEITDSKQYDNYYFYFNNNEQNAILFAHHYITSPYEKFEKKEFLKKNKDLIITFEFLAKLGLYESTQLVGYKKKVYLIDRKDFCFGKIKLKEVKVAFNRMDVE